MSRSMSSSTGPLVISSRSTPYFSANLMRVAWMPGCDVRASYRALPGWLACMTRYWIVRSLHLMICGSSFSSDFVEIVSLISRWLLRRISLGWTWLVMRPEAMICEVTMILPPSGSRCAMQQVACAPHVAPRPCAPGRAVRGIVGVSDSTPPRGRWPPPQVEEPVPAPGSMAPPQVEESGPALGSMVLTTSGCALRSARPPRGPRPSRCVGCCRAKKEATAPWRCGGRRPAWCEVFSACCRRTSCTGRCDR